MSKLYAFLTVVGIVGLLALINPTRSFADNAAFLVAHNEQSFDVSINTFEYVPEINLFNSSGSDLCAAIYLFNNFGSMQDCCTQKVSNNGSTFLGLSNIGFEGPIEVLSVSTYSCDPAHVTSTYGALSGQLDVDDLGGQGINFQAAPIQKGTIPGLDDACQTLPAGSRATGLYGCVSLFPGES